MAKAGAARRTATRQVSRSSGREAGERLRNAGVRGRNGAAPKRYHDIADREFNRAGNMSASDRRTFHSNMDRAFSGGGGPRTMGAARQRARNAASGRGGGRVGVRNAPAPRRGRAR